METKRMRIVSPAFVILFIVTILFVGCAGTRPSKVGEGYGKLAPCPETSNCVSTKATDEKKRMRPLPYNGSMQDAMMNLVRVINSMPRAEIIAQTSDYLYVEFRSFFWGFVDDVEFSFDHEEKTIQFRSASRLGRNDFGVNRRRMEKISELFEIRSAL